VTGARASALNRYRALSLGFVFQFHHLLPDLTAIENVAMPLLINRKSKSQSKEAARQLLDEVGLADQADQAVNTLSGGEQQRVAVARSLITRPILVLADEPTGNLDASIGVEIEAILLRYARQNNGCVLLATHNERLAARCDRRFLLRNGILDEITV
jgi:lipoprotein-releasing system ATP-binding protein